MKQLAARARLAVAAGVFSAAMLYAAPFVLLRRTQYARTVMARGMSAVCLITRLRVRIDGADTLATARPCVAIGNQQSLLCYMVYAKLYRRVPDGGIVARLNGSWDIPLLTWFFRATGNFLVEPGNRPGNRKVTRTGMINARAALRSGRSVWIGPEGTRWKVPGELGPFKPGAFRMAIETGTPIVPMVISPMRPWSDIGAWRLERNDIELRVLDAIPTAGMSRADEAALIRVCRERMQAALTEMADARGLRPSTSSSAAQTAQPAIRTGS